VQQYHLVTPRQFSVFDYVLKMPREERSLLSHQARSPNYYYLLSFLLPSKWMTLTIGRQLLDGQASMLLSNLHHHPRT
jgi:hypothetical protein